MACEEQKSRSHAIAVGSELLRNLLLIVKLCCTVSAAWVNKFGPDRENRDA
jgi:hypothetical protein